MAVESLRTRETQESPRNFFTLLERRQITTNTLLCVGLDSDTTKIPSPLKDYFIDKKRIRIGLQEFNASIINATHDLVCTYKPNTAFYEAHGNAGWDALRWTVNHIKKEYPDIPIILDAKRADIGNTNIFYAQMAFDDLGVDAITVNPYFGGEALQPFLDRKDKGIIIVCKTSNPGSKDFQDDIVKHPELGEVPLYQKVAYEAAHEWNKNGNVCLAVGATHPRELFQVRKIVGDKIPILIPGLGTQGSRPRDLPGGFNSQKRNVIASISRAVIFPKLQGNETFAEAVRREALKWRDAINVYR